MTMRYLETLLQTYLHQDWSDDYRSVWEGVQAFLDEEGPEAAVGLAVELQDVLVDTPSEDDLRELVIDKLRSGYYPPGDGMTFGAWLTAVEQRASSRTGA